MAGNEQLDRLAELRALAEAVPVRGPWRWWGRVKRHPGPPTDINLVGRCPDSGIGGFHMAVGFRRCGMQGAQPTFNRDGIMVRADQVPVYEVTYRDDIVALDDPTARWLVAVDPDTVLMLLDEIDMLRESPRDARADVERTHGGRRRRTFGAWLLDVVPWR